MANIKQLSARPDDLAPGHRLCGGCGASMAVRQVLMGRNDYDVVCCSATGCLEVSTTIYPDNAWEVPFIHNAFANAGATISGVEAAYKGLQRAGKIPADKKIKFVAFGGDKCSECTNFDKFEWSCKFCKHRKDDSLEPECDIAFEAGYKDVGSCIEIDVNCIEIDVNSIPTAQQELERYPNPEYQ